MIAVKQLRDETGAPYGQCKSALMESGGDLSLATDWLRKSGALVGAKKNTSFGSGWSGGCRFP